MIDMDDINARLPPGIRAGTPQSFGWLRRSDLDEHGQTAWETPRGDIQMVFPDQDTVIAISGEPEPPMDYQNPYAGMSLPQIYEKLREGDKPLWPGEETQKAFVGTYRVDLLRRAFQFIDILDQDGAFEGEWKGLDYGCGFGRFASVILSKGPPERLDMCDAWPRAMAVLDSLGHRNRRFKVSELLQDGEIPPGAYSFIMAFSVFTHLSPAAMEHNIGELLTGLRPGGRLYITVRHAEFFEHKYADRAAELNAVLARDGIVFLDSGGDLGSQKVFGDTVVTPDYLSRFGKVRSLGAPHSLQHAYSIENP